MELTGVGANLSDHAYVGFSWNTKNGIVPEGIPLLQATLRFTAPGSTLENDMQINPFQYLPQPASKFYTGLMKPYSRGWLRLSSKDPVVQPDICLNLASVSEDARRLGEGLRLLGKIVQTEPLIELGAHTFVMDTGKTISAKDLKRHLDNATWIDRYVQDTVSHYLHPVGTARMGTDDDTNAVVDQHCRVHGVSNLRVADASIMPTIPRANTHLTCLMIGERVASWMLDESD